MLVPAINSRGKFTFAEPFSNILPANQVFTVVSQRLLTELNDSKDRPYDTIYSPVGLSKNDFDNDVKNDVPIITFSTDGSEYFHVPASKIISQPLPIGVEYQERILAIKLGAIPTSMNLELVKELIVNDVYDAVGIQSTVGEISSSAKVLLSEDEHQVKTQLLNNAKSVTKSYRTRYLELRDLLTKKQQELDSLLDCIKSNNCCE